MDDGVGYAYWLAVLTLSGAVSAPCFLGGDAGRAIAEIINTGATASLVLAFGCLMVGLYTPGGC